jgi:hypothetical protein
MKLTQTLAAAIPLMLGLSAPAFANYQYPFNGPGCHITPLIPQNQAGIFYSEDCQTAFIMPDLYGKTTVSSVSNLSNLDLCDGLSSAYQADSAIQNQLNALLQKMSKTSLGSRDRAEIADEYNQLKAWKKDLFTDYENIVGGYAQVSFAMSDQQSRMKDFLFLNAPILLQKSIQLVPAPISESYISFYVKPPEGAEARLKGVLSHHLVGVAAPDSDGNSEIAQNRMNGAISGQLVLTLPGICKKKTDPAWKPSDLAADLVANVTYTVPVMSIAGYDASLTTDIAVGNLMDALQTRDRFSVRDISTLIAAGVSGNAFTFHVMNSELPKVYTPQEQENFFAALRQDVLERLTSRLLDQMAIAGFLELAAPAQLPTAPEPGFVDEIHTGRNCSSHGPFGLFGNSCHNYQYVVKIPHDSSATAIAQKLADLHFTNTETTDVRQTIHRVYTTTFVPNPDDMFKKGE